MMAKKKLIGLWLVSRWRHNPARILVLAFSGLLSLVGWILWAKTGQQLPWLLPLFPLCGSLVFALDDYRHHFVPSITLPPRTDVDVSSIRQGIGRKTTAHQQTTAPTRQSPASSAQDLHHQQAKQSRSVV